MRKLAGALLLAATIGVFVTLALVREPRTEASAPPTARAGLWEVRLRRDASGAERLSDLSLARDHSALRLVVGPDGHVISYLETWFEGPPGIKHFIDIPSSGWPIDSTGRFEFTTPPTDDHDNWWHLSYSGRFNGSATAMSGTYSARSGPETGTFEGIRVGPAYTEESLQPPATTSGLRIERLCTVIREHYPGIQEPYQAQTFKPTVEAILAAHGIELVTREDACDATLTIDATLRALYATYQGAGWGGVCYNGAILSGQVTFATTSSRQRFALSGRVDPPSSVSSGTCAESPRAAPFRRTWERPLVNVLAAIWGPPIVLSSFTLRSPLRLVFFTRSELAELLGGEADVIVEMLLGDSYSLEQRKAAADFLGEFARDDSASIDALTSVMRADSMDARLRAQVVLALGSVKMWYSSPQRAEVISALSHALESRAYSVRHNAAYSLRRQGVPASADR